MHRRLVRNSFSFAICRAIAFAMAVLLAAAGCSNDAAPSSPLPSVQKKEKSAEPEHPAFTFGIIYPIAHPFYENITASAEHAAAAAGGKLVVKAPDEANVEQQIRMLEGMIRLQLDGIAISPIDSEALAPYIDQAVQSGIPVVCFESDAPGSKRSAYVGGDNKRAGKRMAEALQELLDSGGMVLVETGISSMGSQRERLDGFLDYIRDETNIQVLDIGRHDGNEERALAELEGMIDAHPHFDAFVALDFISGTSSITAWKAMGLSRYALTFGMMPAIEEAIANGQITLAVTQNEAFWGNQIVSALHHAMQGNRIADRTDTGESIVGATSAR